ncbi:preprotein translocase subunit SecA [Dehalococcoidia bacterium]|nr:preprotein translocase subunit SecA [Dehalococcoidia bacterium]
MFNIISKLIGDSNEKTLRKLNPILESINILEDQYKSLSNDELKELTQFFKNRLKDGETTDELLPEAFAAVREASKRVLNMRHFDVQIVGGIVLNHGKISEMRTGEGKTLVATLPAYLNSLNGNSVHIVTVNDYLAKRDASWMGSVYDFLGLSVSCLQNQKSLNFSAMEKDSNLDGNPDIFAAVAGENLKECTRREAYACDVVYGTNNEFGFDYLRDNMADFIDQRVQKGTSFAIVDEVDNILIDEARTPLIISGPAKEQSSEYKKYARIAKSLENNIDFEIEEKRKNIILSDTGISKIEKSLGVNNLYDPENEVMSHFAENAVRAENVYQKNREYVVQNKELIIVDEFTGRLMQGRRFSDGLHQALEAKENLPIQKESVTYATITLQNYFRMYDKLSGMTGTAVTEAEEFEKIYGLEVVEIPTNKPSQRRDRRDLIFMNEDSKWDAIVNKIKELNSESRPVLVGTTSIDKSEHLSSFLNRSGIKHNILNAKQHEAEASVIAQAGRLGAVTVATNMAGRGTDIILGGNPETLNMSDSDWQRDHDEVINKGGLFVLGTERHEARRIDNQLRGRSARQGDAGETQFFLSTEDDIVKRFGGERIKKAMSVLKWDEQIPIENNMITRSVESAQGKVEGQNFEIRKYLVDYDDVVNVQRDLIYKMRDQVLGGEGLEDLILGFVKKEIDIVVSTHLSMDTEEWDIDNFYRDLLRIFPITSGLPDEKQLKSMRSDEIVDELGSFMKASYEGIEEEFGEDLLLQFEKAVLIRIIDQHWVDHLTIMDNMRQGIGLEAAGQRDPLIQYKRMAYQMFNELNDRIGSGVARTIFRVAVELPVTSGHGSSSGLVRGYTKKKSVMSSAYLKPSSTPKILGKEKDINSSNLSRQERRRLERLSKKQR